MKRKRRPTPLALTVLCLLHVGPLHPYLMQRLIKLWGKDEVVNVAQRASLYRVIRQLREAGLISVLQTERDQQFPERTVYQLTEAGRRARPQWLTELLSIPRNEFPEFPAALSFLMMLAPEVALETLCCRAVRLREVRDRLDATLTEFSGQLPRIVLVETEYQCAAVSAELDWVEAVVADLRDGSLTWSLDELGTIASGLLPDSLRADADRLRSGLSS